MVYQIGQREGCWEQGIDVLTSRQLMGVEHNGEVRIHENAESWYMRWAAMAQGQVWFEYMGGGVEYIGRWEMTGYGWRV